MKKIKDPYEKYKSMHLTIKSTITLHDSHDTIGYIMGKIENKDNIHYIDLIRLSKFVGMVAIHEMVFNLLINGWKENRSKLMYYYPKCLEWKDYDQRKH